MSDRPKIFISYSWSPIINKNWTLDFAERLTRDGVHVIIDEWDAKEGQDKYHFMEQMVNNAEVQNVLLICNKDYAEKANKKKGGVGIESQIVSSEIYNNVGQDKFIPIVREYLDEGKACLPTFVSNRFFIDLSNSETFEENYEQLIRRIFGKPKHKRPPVGEAPAYIKEDEPTFLQTAHKFRPLKESLVNGKSNANGLLSDYFDLFNQTLKDFLIPRDIDPNKPPVDELIISKFEQLKALRDEYIEILLFYVKFSKIDPEWLFRMLETSYNSVNFKISDSYYDYNNHLQLFLNEMFLYLVSILLKHEKYDCVSFLLKNHYGVEQEYHEIEFQSYCWIFNKHNRILDEHRNQRLNLSRVSISTDLIKERATNHAITFEDLHDTDILLHYSGLLMHNDSWFPRLSIYGNGSGRPRIIQRLKSKRFFERIKPILGVNDKNELFEKINKLDKNLYNGFHRFNFRFSGIFNAFKLEEICSIE
jgi:hypothetical protein